MFLYQPDSEDGEVTVIADLAAESISTFGEDNEGELYLADIRGKVYRIKEIPGCPPGPRWMPDR